MRCLERVPVCRAEGQNARLGPPVVGFGDCVEFFLARGVPEHQSDFFAVEFDLSLKEVYANCFFVVPGESSLAVPLDHARFPDAAIAHDYHLKKNNKEGQ